MTVCAAGLFLAAFGRQLPGALPHAGERAEVVQAVDGEARGPRLKGQLVLVLVISISSLAGSISSLAGSISSLGREY